MVPWKVRDGVQRLERLLFEGYHEMLCGEPLSERERLASLMTLIADKNSDGITEFSEVAAYHATQTNRAAVTKKSQLPRPFERLVGKPTHWMVRQLCYSNYYASTRDESSIESMADVLKRLGGDPSGVAPPVHRTPRNPILRRRLKGPDTPEEMRLKPLTAYSREHWLKRNEFLAKPWARVRMVSAARRHCCHLHRHRWRCQCASRALVALTCKPHARLHARTHARARARSHAPKYPRTHAPTSSYTM